MAGRRRLVLPLFVWVLAATLAGATARADDAPVDHAAFEAGFAKARRLLGRAKCAQGLELVQELLEAHAEKDYVLACRVEVEDLVRRLAFGSENPAPKPKDLISGKLIRYVPTSGKIRVRYTPTTCGDLQDVGNGIRAFPARMKGPFTVTLEGRALPTTLRFAPQVIAGNERDPKSGKRHLWILFSGSGHEVPAKLIHRVEKESTERGNKDPSPAKRGKPYKLILHVHSRKISGSVNGRVIGTTAKPAGVFGAAAFLARDWTVLTIDGQVEPSWIQGKIDDVVQKALEEFRKTYDPAAFLPAWLLSSAATDAPPAAPEAARWPHDVPAAHYDDLDACEALIEEGRAGAAAARLLELGTKRVPLSALAYLTAHIHFRSSQLKKALGSVGTSLEQAPTFLSALLLRGRILSRMGLHDEALSVFEAAQVLHPTAPAVYERATVHLLRAGLSGAAQTVLARAAKEHVSSDELEALARALAKAASGPSWTRVYDYESLNYHVFSDIDETTCRKSAKILEEAYRSYQGTLRRVRRDGSRRFNVYLFRGQRGFVTYMKDLGTLGGTVPPTAAGLYSPILKQLLIWNLPNREMMLRTVRHEGLHQYLDRFLPNVPVWFNEGLAEYYEHGHRVAGRLYFGRVNHDHLKVLEKHPPIPLKDFLYLSKREFYRGGIKNYAQAWAFMHLLREGGTRRKLLFKQILADLERMPAHEVMEKAFGEMDLKKLDEEFRAHLGEM